MRVLIIMLLAITTIGCQNERRQARQDIRRMENRPLDSLNQNLQQAYLDYVDQFPQDSVYAAHYLGRAAALEYSNLQYSAAITLLYRALRDYYTAPASADNLRIIYQLYVKEVQVPFLTNTLVQAARRSFPETAGEWQLTEDLPALEDRLNERRSKVYADAAQGINYQSANEFITATELYALLLPQTERAPEYLFNAAEIARGLGVYRRSLGLLDWIVARYPESERAPQASFLKAFTLDEQLRDTTAAREAYQHFIEQYPDDDFTDDARILLEALE